MSRKERIKTLLQVSRSTSEKMLADFKTPKEWTFQVHPDANHALWFAGHMASTDNFFLSWFAPEKSQDLPGYKEKFGMGSKPVCDPAAYPPAADVLAVMRERRQTLLALLDRLSDADLEKPKPKGGPEFMSDVGSVFEFIPWHEGLHTGQISIARRALGHSPLMSGPPAAK